MSDLSLHIDCTYRWEEIKTFLASPNVTSAFLLNPSPEQIDYALQHCTLVIGRIYDPFNERASLGEDFEKSIVNRRKPQDFVNWLDASPFRRFKNDNRIRWELGWNELYSKRGQLEHQQNDNVVAIGQAMVDAGYGVGLGGWASDKSFYADDVVAGHWDSVIRFCANNPNMVSLDAHEYDVLTIFNGHLKGYPNGFPDTLKTAYALDPNNHAKIPYTRAEGDITTNYKIGRIALLLQRSLDILGRTFFWFRGECALDFKDDGSLKPFIDGWYKPKFPHPTGINSLLPYYRHVLGQELTEKQYDELIFRQHVDMVKQDPDSCQANFIFASNGDHPRWLPFDVLQRPYFVSLVANHKSEDTVTEQPTPIENPFNPTLYEADVRVTNDTWNMRPIMVASPAIEVIGELTTEARTMMVSKETAQGSTYRWYKFKEGDIEGYFAHTEKLDIKYAVDDVPVTPPVDNPDTPDTPTSPPDGITAEQLANAVQEATEPLEARIDALEVINQANTARITALENDIAKMLEPVIIDVPDISWSAPRLALPMIAAMFEGLELQFRLNKEFAQGGTPTPPATAQTLNPLTDSLPPAELDAQSFKPTLDDIDFQESTIPDMSVDTQGVVTFTNEPADDTNEQTLTDIMLNGNDMPSHQIHFDENDNRVQGTGDDDSDNSEELAA